MRLRHSAPLMALALVPALASAQESSSAPDVFKKASPSLVTISTPVSFGSGVMIDATGIIVTNLHVIRGADAAVVKLATGQLHEAPTVVGVDPQKDLALLKIDGASFTAVELGNSQDAAVGERVYAIGAPKGLELTMTDGIVSGRRDSPVGYQLIQTSAALSSGSSGGGLFDQSGRLIAVTTSKIDDGESLNFAIPVNYVRDMLADARRWTLAELNAHLASTNTPSGTSASPLTTHVGGVPQLGAFYTNTTGDIAVLRQSESGQVWVTFRSGGTTYGTADLQWDAARKAFLGTGTYKALCSSDDRQAWEVPVQQEIVHLNQNVMRVRWMLPVGVDCGRRVIRSYSPQDVVWFVPSQQ